MKEMLGNLASGQIEFYKAVCEYSRRIMSNDLISFDRQWRSGRGLYP